MAACDSVTPVTTHNFSGKNTVIQQQRLGLPVLGVELSIVIVITTMIPSQSLPVCGYFVWSTTEGL